MYEWLLKDRDNQERNIRIGREPFKTHAIAEPKTDDANAEQDTSDRHANALASTLHTVFHSLNAQSAQSGQCTSAGEQVSPRTLQHICQGQTRLCAMLVRHDSCVLLNIQMNVT